MERATSTIDRTIQNMLISLGVAPNLLGFTYLTEALMLVYENPKYKQQITKRLYPDIAKTESTTPTRVERAIRHAIETAWLRGNTETLADMFGDVVPKGCRPTNSEFISMLVLKLEQEREKGYSDVKSQHKVTKRDQKLVSEIITQFMFTKTMDDVMEVWKRVYEEYGLCDDPFTHTPCTPDEYCKNRSEYDKQTMIEKYGHCDGLE